MTQAEEKTQGENTENQDGDGGNSAAQDSQSESTQVMTGLQFAAFFFLCFALVGYPLLLSALMGVIGGTASGWIATWWYTNDELKEEAHLLDDELGGTAYASRASMRKLRQQRYLSSRNRYRNRRNRSIFSWFFETGGGR